MIIKKAEGTTERAVLIGMITDDRVMARISSQWRRDLFSSKWSNVISTLCQRYFQKHKKAPGRNIQSLFASWATKQKDESTINLVEKFLGSLSDEYEDKEQNSEHTIDIAKEHFNKVKLRKLVDQLDGDLHNGDISDAITRLAEFHSEDIDLAAGIDVLQDMDSLRSAFDKETDVLIQYPGALGRFFSDHLCRDGFIAFQGPEKFGKSFWLYDMAWRAVQQRRRVAYFIIGDMSEHQVLKRIASRATRHPYRISGGFPGSIKYPTSIIKDKQTKKVLVEHELRKFKKPVSWKQAWKAFQKVQDKLQTKKSLFKLACYPSLSISVAEIESVIKTWEYSDWGTPDVVVIDYADNLKLPSGISEYRNQINHNWKQMRALSQSLHVLVLTATQSDINASLVETQTRQNFSDDKRKLAEVTGLFTINRTIEERSQQLARIGCLALRDGEFVETFTVNVAGCYGIAAPAVKSCF